jgi:AMMECR1 domain-containing protein
VARGGRHAWSSQQRGGFESRDSSQITGKSRELRGCAGLRHAIYSEVSALEETLVVGDPRARNSPRTAMACSVSAR